MKMAIGGILFALLYLSPRATLHAAGPEPAAPDSASEIIVYGGTPAGIIAAIAAAREGAKVVVIEPSKWIGGMVAGGLSKSDIGKQETIGGYTREFFTRAAARYGGAFMWYAEPHANRETFEAMLGEAKVTVIKDTRLKSVAKDLRRIASLTTDDGQTFAAQQFIDATYEGDLMAAAASYRVGRESQAEYGEELAGYHPMPLRPRSVEVMESDCQDIGGKGPGYIHGTPAAISGLDENGSALFGVFADPKLVPGCADKLTQSYNFRICVTQRPEIRVPFPKPAAYDPARYELLLRLINAFPGIRFGRLFHLGEIASGKFDLNAQGFFSTDYPGANTDYPGGDAATRERIWRDHVAFIQGMLWFLCHDERVPKSLRGQASTWGLCKDEFADNGCWPYALYVREARRMIGDYVMVQKDLQRDVSKPDSVGMGSFVIDCHIVQRILSDEGTVRDEGSFQDAPVKPYQIPYRSLTPKMSECENLLVPVCLSGSHIAYCSLRMEPVYMALGHAAGVASVMAMKCRQPVQAIDVAALQRKLRAQKAVLELAPRASVKLEGSVADDDAAVYSGAWTASDYGSPLNEASHHDNNEGKGAKQARFEITVPEAARYDVRFAYISANNRASNVPVTIEHEGGRHTGVVNEKTVPKLNNHFVSLGIFQFTPAKPAVVIVNTTGTDGFVSVDAVQLIKVSDKQQ
jgi:hypothetical protein